MAVINLTVTTTADELNGGQNGLSLREAIDRANNDSTNEYVITLNSGSTYRLTAGFLEIENGADVTIQSSGDQPPIIEAAGVSITDDSHFYINDSGFLETINITMTGATDTANGSSIINSGLLFLADTTFLNNGGTSAGAVVYNLGTTLVGNSTFQNNSSTAIESNNSNLIIFDSTFDNNRDSLGGIVQAYGEGQVYIDGSTFTNNDPDSSDGVVDIGDDAIGIIYESTIKNNFGTGVLNSSPFSGPSDNQVFVLNSTISNNTGWGIISEGISQRVPSVGESYVVNSTISGNGEAGIGNGNGATVFVSNSTITNNIIGIRNGSGTVEIDNSIVANNRNNEDVIEDVIGAFDANKNNLIGNTANSTGFGGTDLVNVNPRLGPLQDNGGPTFTHALLSDSPAINAGNNSFVANDFNDIDFDNNTSERLPYDQRGEGFNRIVGSAVDIGAYEVQEQTQTTTVTVQVSPTSVTENGTPNLVYTFTRTGSTTSALSNVNFGVGGAATFSSDYT
ncbi:choice-of-anchor Q domain-containing protein, partial [Gloeocapsa sp. PCC 73106]|uniref:choice-of-anchor Q domain-containing protein n=1 Tax=Gloeocapsa sp. PCC 73106 TaxID=102232 RepID=UPI0002AC5F6D